MARGGKRRDFRDRGPEHRQKLADVASAGQADVDAAVAAARGAFEGAWSKVKPDERAKLINRLADLIEARGEELALTETLDVGRPIQFSRMIDVGGAVGQLRYQAGWATKIQGETNEISRPANGSTTCCASRSGGRPDRAVELPAGDGLRQARPGAAAGCTVVLKPAEQTPLSTIVLGELALEAGFPEGVINVVTGYGRTAGAALASHMDVDKVAFTGSTATGRRSSSQQEQLQARQPRARRQVADLHLRRRRPQEGDSRGGDGDLLQRRPGLRRGQPAVRAGGSRRPGARRQCRHGEDAARRPHARSRDDDRAAGQRGAARPRDRLHRQRPPGRRHGHGRRRRKEGPAGSSSRPCWSTPKRA
jgi:hypothetical protein